MSVVLDGYARDFTMTKNGRYVAIDTRWTRDHGYETMVFRCDEYGNIKSFEDLDVDWYATKEEADVGHAEMVNKWMKEALP